MGFLCVDGSKHAHSAEGPSGSDERPPPRGCGFGDYWRMGLPLEIIVIAVAIPVDPVRLAWLSDRKRDDGGGGRRRIGAFLLALAGSAVEPFGLTGSVSLC